MMGSVSSANRSARSNGAWVVDIVMPDAPKIRHLIVVEAGAGSELLYEPIQNSEPTRVGELLESAFKRLAPPAKIVTDGSREFSDDRFRLLLAADRMGWITSSPRS
jgi:hypothetical protein